jgi:hypothetical protein
LAIPSFLIAIVALQQCHSLVKDPVGLYLDNQSWNDFNLDDVFETLDRTESVPGQFVLYNWLSQP